MPQRNRGAKSEPLEQKEQRIKMRLRQGKQQTN